LILRFLHPSFNEKKSLQPPLFRLKYLPLMLGINALKNAALYHTNSLTKGDYYSEQAEISGAWEGLGASRLGLFGDIQKEHFDRLCAGHHPLTGEQLSTRIVADRREAFDFTFSVPKSVSVLSAVSSPEVAILIQDQITESVKFTMAEVEKNIQTRIRESGKNDNRVTGNIVYGYFLHKNARPVNGYSDPQLHVHAVVMNLTFDGVEKKWKAVQIRDKAENREYYQNIFHSNLASRFQTLGVEIRKTPMNYELNVITEQSLKNFSRRTQEIEKEALAQNIKSADAKSKLGARTRQSKTDKYSQSELQAMYQNILSPDQKLVAQNLSNQLQFKIDNNLIDYKLLNQNLLPQNLLGKNLSQNSGQISGQKGIQIATQDQTKKWLDYTLENHFERHSTSSEQRLIGEVLKNGIGQTNLELVTKEIEQYKKQKVLVTEVRLDPNSNNTIERIQARNNLSPSITTQVALQEEQSIVRSINSQINIFNPINTRYAKEIQNDTFLNTNQKQVISKVMLSLDGVSLLEGKAGTGKTTTLKSIEHGLTEQGYTITTLASTSKAVEVLQAEGFENSMTVSKYLSNANKKDSIQDNTTNQDRNDNQLNQSHSTQNPKNYLIVDEASLVSVRQMDKLLKLAIENDQRVLLVGDTKQHKSVERGNTLKTIQSHSEIETYSLNQIQRQKQTEAKLAVEDLSQGKVMEGIQKFQKLGFVKEIEDDKARLEKVAQIYVGNLQKVTKNTIQSETIKVEKERSQNQVKDHQQKSFLQKLTSNELFGKKKEYEDKTQYTKETIEYQKLDNQRQTLVITPTHNDGQDIHNSIREKLKQENLIDQKDHTIQTIRSLSWTTAQKGEITNYQPGQVLQFSGNIQDFKKGEKYEVVERQTERQEVKEKLVNQKNPQIPTHQENLIDPNQNSTLQIQNTRTKETKEIPTHKPSYFEVYKKQELTISKGDLIQSQNRGVVKDKEGKDHQIANGGVYQIKSISPKSGDLTLSNNWIIPSDYGNIKSAYYSTSQAAQGQTVNHSIFYTSTASLPLINQEMVYVANSRFKQTNTILTPDLQEFKTQAMKGEIKSIALDVVKERQGVKDPTPEKSKSINKSNEKTNEKELSPTQPIPTSYVPKRQFEQQAVPTKDQIEMEKSKSKGMEMSM
jgi:conjugative relaxase-like TrwC/TraI family protein